MPVAALALAAALLAAPAREREEPRALVREATRAVEDGNAEQLRAALQARLAADAGDRGAALALATMERLTYDYAAAEPRLRALAGAGAPADRVALHARLELARARDAQGFQGGLAAELRALAAEARRLGDRAAEAEASFELAAAVVNTEGVEAALAAVARGLRSVPADAPDVAASLRCRRGLLLALVARLAEAERDIRAGAELARAAHDPRAEALCLRSVATHEQLRGDVDASIATLRRAAELRRAIHDRGGRAVVLMVLFDHLRMTGEIGEAAALVAEARAEAEASHNLYAVASASLLLGATALTLGDHVAAGEHVERAVAGYDALGDEAAAFQARSFRPFVSLAAGDLPRARREVDEVLPWAVRRGDLGHLVALHRQRFEIELRAGDLEAAAAALARARAVSRRQTPPLRERELALDAGRLALRRGSLDEAESALGASLAAAAPEARLERYELEARLAEVHARRGELDRAADALTAASEALEAWRATLGDRELRVLAFQASPQEASDLDATVARVIAALAEGGRAEAAFDLAERRRARELADRLTRARALRASAHGAAGPAPAAVRPVRAAELAALLPDERTAVVELVTGAGGAPTTALVVRREPGGVPRVLGRTLAPAADLVGPLSRLLALLEAGGVADAPATALGAALLDPLAPLYGPDVARLVIVPDGPLHRVPWDALRLASGGLALERLAIGVAPSAAILAALWQERGSEIGGRPPRLLALGDPVFPGGAGAPGPPDAAPGGAEPYREAFDAAGGLPRLEGSAREARLVARYAPDADVRLREAASAAFLKRADLTGYDVLHLATHAVVDDHRSARTALALSPGEGESGFVTAADLAALRLEARLVVLSACRSAGGVVVSGEGIQGLTAPLLQAGARSVVATLWRVGDRAVVPLLDDLYAGLARGQRLSDALQGAKLAALRRGAPARDWAALVAFGDPAVTVALEPPPTRGRWAAAGMATALLLAGAVARARRARARCTPAAAHPSSRSS